MPYRKLLVLVVDDDPGLLKLVRVNLEMEGYSVITALDGETALQLTNDEKPALILLDIMMPGMDGFQVCEYVRQTSEVPIIMLTAKGRQEEIVHGLDIGADDYVVKPFGVKELLSRVKAVLRRKKFPKEMPQPLFTSGELCIDFSGHQVTVDGKEVVLPPTEYRVLCLLARNAGRVITLNYLLAEIWGDKYLGDIHILQVAIARLRKKIGDDASNPKYIFTRPGIGYTFKQP